MHPRIHDPVRVLFFCLVLACGLSSCGSRTGQAVGNGIDRDRTDSLYNMAESQAGVDADLARRYLGQARISAGTEPNDRARARSHIVEGRILYYCDEYPASVRHFDSALVFLESVADPGLQADCHFYCASSLLFLGSWPEALSHNLQAIDLYQQYGHLAHLSRSYTFHSKLYLDQKSFDLALDYVEKAAALSGLDPVSLNHANVHATKGEILLAAGRIHEAGVEFREAYDIRLRCANLRHIASSLVQLGTWELERGDYLSARTHLEEVKGMYEDMEEKVGLFNARYLLARVERGEGRTENARNQALRALDIARSLDNDAMLAPVTGLLHEIHRDAGNYQEALSYHEQHMAHHDRIVSMDKNRMLTRIEYRHALENQTRDNALLQERNRVRKQQVYLLLLVAVALLLCTIGLLLVGSLRKKNLQNRQELLEKEKLLLEQDLETRNKELTGKTMELLHHTETMQHLAGRIGRLKEGDSRREIESILQDLKVQNREHMWDEFHAAFHHVHRDFYDRLFARCSDLSPTEIKIAALLRLNLSTKEIAAISFKSESAVKTARHRLRTKLGLGPGNPLIAFLMQL
ncbi:MAG: hypothetical protein R2751_12925 [Bacteroidales bacterium]